jgi:hypothetical protein
MRCCELVLVGTKNFERAARGDIKRTLESIVIFIFALIACLQGKYVEKCCSFLFCGKQRALLLLSLLFELLLTIYLLEGNRMHNLMALNLGPDFLVQIPALPFTSWITSCYLIFVS